MLLQSPHGDWRKRPGMALAARDKARPEHPSTSTSVSKLSSQPRILSCPSAPVQHCPQVGNSHGHQKVSAQLTTSPGEEKGGFQDPQHQQVLFQGPLMPAQSPQETRRKTEPLRVRRAAGSQGFKTVRLSAHGLTSPLLSHSISITKQEEEE